MADHRTPRSALLPPLLALPLLASAALLAPSEAAVGQSPYPVASTTPPIPASYADLLPPPEAAPAPIEAPPLVEPASAGPAAIEAAPDEPVAVEAVPEPVASPAAEPITPIVDDAIATEPVPAEPELHWYHPTYWFGPAPWDSGIELGLNGAGGTSESISFRTGGFIKREADDYKFDASLYYNKTESEGIEVQSNALLDVRYDWLFDNSPWTLFVMSQTFYDEFQAFDVNLNGNAGFGYQWIDSETLKLTTSVGSGVSREFGGPDSEWVPEASFGFKFERQLAENRKFYAKADWFPEWEDFGNYRILADVGMEFELHQPSNVSLKLSATDRYDSNPDGVEPHNLNYSALLIWKM